MSQTVATGQSALAPQSRIEEESRPHRVQTVGLFLFVRTKVAVWTLLTATAPVLCETGEA